MFFEKCVVNNQNKLAVNCIVLNNINAFKAVQLLKHRERTLAGVKTIVIEDQVVPANSTEISEQQQYMAAFASEYGLDYVYGQAMAPHYLLQDKVKKGDIVVSGDADIAMIGAVGAIGIAVNAEKLSGVLTEGCIELPQTQKYRVKLVGSVKENVDIRDVAQKLVSSLAGKVAGNTVIEMFSDNCLSLEEKMVLCGWCQKLNVLTTVFTEEAPEVFDYVLDFSIVESSLENVEEAQVMAVFIGGNYGGSLEAIKLTAEMLAGKKIAYKVRLSVAPATADIYVAAADAGYITDILEADGLVLNQCALPPVQARIGEGEVMVSNDIHDEEGYAGKLGKIYLASTYKAVKTALNGKIGGEK